MGFFSSLAKPFKKVLDFGKDLVGNVVESVVGDPLGAIGTVGKVVGGIMGNNSQSAANDTNQALAQQQFQFQKDYIQNQMQWRMADAQKAGIHPLAALGIQSPGFSPVSSSSSGLDYSWLGDLGQSANYSATKAKTTPEQQKMVDLQLQNMQLQNDLLQTQIDNMKVDALASSIAANQAFDSPPSPKVNLTTPTGIPSDPKPEDLFTFGVDGNGKKSRIYPTDFMTSTWEDRPVGSSLAPLAEAEKLEQDAKLRGTVVLGHVWSPDAGEFVPVGSNAGRRALDYWKRAKSSSPGERIKAKYPREKMNSLDRGFFDWVDRIFQ